MKENTIIRAKAENYFMTKLNCKKNKMLKF